MNTTEIIKLIFTTSTERMPSPNRVTTRTGPMSTKFIATNAASGGINLDRKTLERVAGRSERPGLFFLAQWGLAPLATGGLVHTGALSTEDAHSHRLELRGKEKRRWATTRRAIERSAPSCAIRAQARPHTQQRISRIGHHRS